MTTKYAIQCILQNLQATSYTNIQEQPSAAISKSSLLLQYPRAVCCCNIQEQSGAAAISKSSLLLQYPRAVWCWSIITCGVRSCFIIQTMSSIGRNELSATEKAFKYEFSLQILALKCEIPFPSSLRFSWKRNSKGIESKSSYEVGSGAVHLALQERLSSISTIIFNTEKREFLPKESELIINMYFNSSPKKLASTKIDMRTILDANNYKLPRCEAFEVQLKPCVNVAGACKLQYKLSSVFKEELVPSERSIGSNTLNMSGLSIQQQKYFQKKYDVPSKDNYSVTSYNAVGRHPSANKRDDNSIRKFDYAYLTGLKSNISNPQADFDTKSGFKSIENKTEFGEGNYLNRQLIEEQSRRSRAEAELNKNTVQIGQLKKKINQLAIENLKMKELGLKETASKEEINALQFKLYELNNETREARSQLDLRKKEYDAEIARFRTEKSSFEAELLSRQKRIEELQRSTLSAKLAEELQKDNRELKYQAQSLRKYLQQSNRQHSEQQEKSLRETQQLKSQMASLVAQKEQLALLQNQRDKALKERQFAASRELEEYKSRLSRYEAEKATLQREIIRLQAEAEGRLGKFSSDCARSNDQLRYYELKLDEVQRAAAKLEQEKQALESRSNKLLPQMNQLTKKLNQSQAELSLHKTRYNQLQSELSLFKTRVGELSLLKTRVGELQSENSRLQAQQNELSLLKTRVGELQSENSRLKTQQSQSKMYSSSSGEVDRLMRQCLQQQVELKFVKDELSRLQGLQEAYETQKWRADKQRSQRESLEREGERMEKELTSKTRALMIEIEKTKHINEEMASLLSALGQYKQELEKSRSIIYAGQQQTAQLREAITLMQAELGRTNEENRDLRLERQRLASSSEEIRSLQLKVAELEKRDGEKLDTIENQNRNCMLAQSEIKQLQNRVQYLQYEVSGKDKTASELQARSRELQRLKSSLQAQRSRAVQELRQQQKKNRMIMEQIHGMKKKLEQEKGRSTSFTRVEQSNRMRDMDAALEKKDKMISKLNKDKLQLEEENIKKNVQVMKLLTELEKLRANNISTSISAQSSLKVIGLK